MVFGSNSSENPSNLVYLTILVTVRTFTKFQHKIKATKLQESAKTCLTL